jgi:hypothetical protein
MNCNASIDPSCIGVFNFTLPPNTNTTFDNVTSPLNQTNQTVGTQSFDSKIVSGNQTFQSKIFGGNIFGGNLSSGNLSSNLFSGNLFSGIEYPSIIAIVVALVGLILVMKYGGVGKKVDNATVPESSKEGEDVKSDTAKDK